MLTPSQVMFVWSVNLPISNKNHDRAANITLNSDFEVFYLSKCINPEWVFGNYLVTEHNNVVRYSICQPLALKDYINTVVGSKLLVG